MTSSESSSKRPPPTLARQPTTTLIDVFAQGKVPYIAAHIRGQSAYERATLFAGTFLAALWVVVAAGPLILLDLVRLVVPRARKNVFGQTALVTGAGNGIGKAIALRLAREGCNVAVADLDMRAAEQTVREVRALNVQAHPYVADVASPADVDKMHRDIQRDMGGAVDILVNNVGHMSMQSLRDGTDEQMERLIKINLFSHLYTIRKFLPDMLERRRGHIVGMSSMAGLHPTPMTVLYSAAKFGVAGMMDGIAAEVREEGLSDAVHFTTVYPYFVSTRQDVMDAVSLRFPPLTADVVADEAVLAMLRNERSVSVPRYLYFLCLLMRMMPDRVQGMIRDYILFESGTRNVEFLQSNNNSNGNGGGAAANGVAHVANGIANGH